MGCREYRKYRGVERSIGSIRSRWIAESIGSRWIAGSIGSSRLQGV